MQTLLFDALMGHLKKKKHIPASIKNILEQKSPLTISGLQSSFLTVFLAAIYRFHQKSMAVVVPSEREAEDLVRDFETLGVPALQFPWYGVMPYSPVPENSAVFGQRMRFLSSLLQAKDTPAVFVIPVRSVMSAVPPPDWFQAHTLSIRCGMSFDPRTVVEKLVSFGYVRVKQVGIRGEFALRGEVLDIFPPGYQDAVRIVFSFDTVEAIRLFDISSQTSLQAKTGTLSKISVYPVKEILWDTERIDILRERLRSTTQFPDDGRDILQTLTDFRRMEREELFYPLSFSRLHSVFEYFDSDTILFLAEHERLFSAAEGVAKEYSSLHRQTRTEGRFPLPEDILLDFGESLPEIAIACKMLPGEQPADIHFSYNGPRSFFGNLEYVQQEISTMIDAGYRVVIGTENERQAARVSHMLADLAVEVVPENLQNGFSLPDSKIALIQEHEIFGRRKRAPAGVRKAQSKAIETFIELEPGDLVVHVNYGIGRFCGIQRICAAGNERDYVHLEYAGDEFIYIPIEQVNLVQRYIGQDGDSARLDRIGGKSWENRKTKVKKSVEELAERLLALYSKRRKIQGFRFPPDANWQAEFEAAFPYQETPDQLQCIEEVKADMEEAFPMDRLICGDVGFGKTEIALRAAFKAVTAGKQVAFLAPTTILVEQHYENLESRLARFPVRVGMLSRFVSAVEQKKVIAGIKDGSVDIVIGTHRLLSRDVFFKDLGLMIVDEEQRFGVKHKERLKEIRTAVDSLSLSATPIPRTLHMSLLKIRDMSVIQTPPGNRMPIETVIREFDEQLIADAIRREMQRGGQVYFLHNRIETLDHIRLVLERLVPEAMIDVAHGQMSANELEDIMHRFIHGAFQVLVATSIIENGIDIPNVNTIIIDRADMFGISQLYQLRGRVGRSDRPAYAFLLYPEDRVLSELAAKRLQVISDHTELGSGFKVAMKDLEVRGAGNLLGPQQSGEIAAIGFDLYLKLLDEAIQRLQSDESYLDEQETYLELEYSGFVPDSYIDDQMDKMEVYKKIASIKTEDELISISEEIADRFGPLPDELQSLLALAEIRILCYRLHISMLRERKGVVTITFARLAQIDIDKAMEAIRVSGGSLRPDPSNAQNLILHTQKVGLKEKSEFIREKLSSLL